MALQISERYGNSSTNESHKSALGVLELNFFPFENLYSDLMLGMRSTKLIFGLCNGNDRWSIWHFMRAKAQRHL
jgi:hypothetical protein